jgi:hypothetical protein
VTRNSPCPLFPSLAKFQSKWKWREGEGLLKKSSNFEIEIVFFPVGM